MKGGRRRGANTFLKYPTLRGDDIGYSSRTIKAFFWQLSTNDMGKEGLGLPSQAKTGKTCNKPTQKVRISSMKGERARQKCCILRV